VGVLLCVEEGGGGASRKSKLYPQCQREKAGEDQEKRTSLDSKEGGGNIIFFMNVSAIVILAGKEGVAFPKPRDRGKGRSSFLGPIKKKTGRPSMKKREKGERPKIVRPRGKKPGKIWKGTARNQHDFGGGKGKKKKNRPRDAVQGG